MRIAVIADTHGRFPDHLAAALRDADEIWHLGDFCELRTLEAVRALNKPFEAVLGNNDWSLDLPETLTLQRAGRTFHLIHIPPAPRKIGGADFLLHGHTHVPRDEMVGETRVLNPGCVSRPNKGAPSSFAWLDITDDGSVTWRLVLL